MRGNFGRRLDHAGVAPICSLLAMSALALGCTADPAAQNAALELTFDLPPGPVGGPSTFVLIQPRRAAENPFEDEWAGSNLEAVELTPGERLTDEISVLANDDSADLHIKVRFCSSATCSDLGGTGPIEIWYKLNHPFYVGQRTFWKTADPQIPSIPTVSDTAPFEVDRCQIRGCVDGDLSSYCRVNDRHLCEDEPGSSAPLEPQSGRAYEL